MKNQLKFLFFILLMFCSCSNIDNRTSSSLSFVPADSDIIININDINNTKEFLSRNKTFSDIISSKKLILNQLNNLSSINSVSEGIFTLSSFGKNQIAYTYIRKTNSKDSISLNDIVKGEYQKNKVFVDSSKNDNVYKVIIDEYIISSSEDIIIENIIRDYKNTYQNIGSEFLKIFKTIEKNELFNIIAKSGNFDLIDNQLNQIPFFPESTTSWIGYDVKYSLDNFYLSGATRFNDSINGKISILKNIYPTEIKTDNIIPNSFSSFLTYTINDSERFIFNYKNYLKLNDISSEILNFESLNLINEISFVADQEKFLILGISNIDQINNYFKFNEFDSINNILKIEVDNGLSSIFKNIDNEIIINYAVLIGNSLVLAKSVSQIKKVINSQKINDNLGSNTKYLNLKNQKSKNYSFLWVANNNNSSSINSKIYPFISFSGRINQDIALLEFDFSKGNINNERGDIFSEFFSTYDNEIVTNPQWLRNHLTNQFDIAFQDSENYLYYLSNKGDQYWRKKLSSKIIGEISQVDIYKNGRLQLVFRTADRLYLLDRNGNEVRELSFEIYSSDIENPISIFDYEKNRNYRFLILEDNKIKMFDSSGKIVSGFKPNTFNSRIIKPPVHIRIDNKDYIVVQLENGDLKILDRRGRDRIIINEKIKFSRNSIFSYLKNFTTTDNQGNLIKINTDGNLIKENLNLSYDNLIDVKNDNLVYLSENTISIMGLTLKIPYGKYSKPLIFNELKNTFIAITELDQGIIYLYKDNGELVKGFPIKGNSIIDLKDSDNDGKIEIITRLDNYSIVSYEIN